MAKARNCDVCEKYYKPYNETRMSKKPNSMRFTISESDDSTWGCGDRIDLCPDCLKSIAEHIEFLRTEKKEEK